MAQSSFRQADLVRLGVLVPSVNTVVEPDMYRMAPPGLTIHFARLPVPSDAATVENLEHLEDYLDESLQSLVHARVKAVAFACTSGSFIKGAQWDRHLIERMEKMITPATTTSDSVVLALRNLGVVKLALVTPYPDPINELMEAYLNDQGFQVANLKSLRLSRSDEIKSISPEAIFDLARSADTKDSEGMLISCTDFQAVPIISALEEDIGKPVISSNQATLWRLLTLTGKNTSVKGYGYLMNKPTEEVS